MTEHLCVCCPQLRPGDPRVYERPMVCGGCRSRLRSLLAEGREIYLTLDASPGSGVGQRVSGSREPALPVRVTVVDLTMPARVGVVHDPNHDQTGHPGVASVLDCWVRDWRGYRRAGEGLPTPTAPELFGWLAVRLDWACDVHPAIDEFASEMRALVAALHAAAGAGQARPEPCDGVPCRRCDLLTLVRLADGSGDVECANPDCRVLYGRQDYEQWCRLVASPLKNVVPA